MFRGLGCLREGVQDGATSSGNNFIGSGPQKDPGVGGPRKLADTMSAGRTVNAHIKPLQVDRVPRHSSTRGIIQLW
eukprot:4970807-Pyramimonas_sp.AAC.1